MISMTPDFASFQTENTEFVEIFLFNSNHFGQKPHKKMIITNEHFTEMKSKLQGDTTSHQSEWPSSKVYKQ